MKSATKALVLATGTYVGTVCTAGAMAAAVVAVMSPRSCTSYGRALVVLWAAIGSTFLLGWVTGGLAVLRLDWVAAARWGVVVVIGAALLATYGVVALGLMVAFNC